MGQPPPLQRRTGDPREPVQPHELAMVHHWFAHAAGFGHCPQGRVDAHGGGHVVVLHAHHDLLVHGQPGRLPHRRAHGLADRERRGPGQADQDQVRRAARRLHRGLLQGFQLLDVPAHVVLHGVGAAVRLHGLQRRGRGPRRQGQGQLRLPHGVHVHRVRHRAQLRAHPDRRPARLQGLRHRHASQFAVPHRHQRRRSEAAGGGQAAHPQDQVVEGEARRRLMQGRPEQEQLGRQRAGPGQRGRRVRGAAGGHGRGLRHRRGRVRLEGAQGGRGGAAVRFQGKAATSTDPGSRIASRIALLAEGHPFHSVRK